jgi:hypothetical protein
MSHATPRPPATHVQLEGVNQRLAEMIDSLRKGRERMLASRAGAESGTPVPGAPAEQREVELRLRARVDELEAQQQRACEELVEAERQLTHFAALFAALRQLHEATTHAAVLDAIQEIVVNLVGSEELVVLEAERGGALRVARTFGLEPAAFEGLRQGEGPLGEAALGPAVLAAPDPRLGALGGRACGGAGAPAPTAVVPLRAGGSAAGAVLVYRLLGHKPRLGPSDLDILELLQLHGALALRAAPREGADDARR